MSYHTGVMSLRLHLNTYSYWAPEGTVRSWCLNEKVVSCGEGHGSAPFPTANQPFHTQLLFVLGVQKLCVLDYMVSFARAKDETRTKDEM